MEVVGKFIALYFETIVPWLGGFMPMELAVCLAVLVPVVTFLSLASTRFLWTLAIGVFIAWFIAVGLPFFVAL